MRKSQPQPKAAGAVNSGGQDIVKVVVMRNGENKWSKKGGLTGWFDKELSKKGVA